MFAMIPVLTMGCEDPPPQREITIERKVKISTEPEKKPEPVDTPKIIVE
jgi:hypothetical protein